MKLPFFSRGKEQYDGIILWSQHGIYFAKRRGESVTDVAPLSFVKLSGAPSTLLLVFESDAGTPIDEQLLWVRERPHDPVTLPEMRAILHELDVRAKEHVRRDGWEGAALSSLPIQRRQIRFDGKRILNPLGFTGRTLIVRANQLWLSSQAIAFVSELRKRFPKTTLASCFTDDLATETFASFSPDAIVLLQERTTVVTKFSRDSRVRREICAIGQDSMCRALARHLSLSSREEAERLLHAVARGDLQKPLERKIETLLAPLLLVWAQAVTGMLGLKKQSVKAPETLLFLTPVAFLPPFQRGLTKKVLHRLFPFTEQSLCQTLTLRHVEKDTSGKEGEESAVWLWAAAHVSPSIPSEFAL